MVVAVSFNKRLPPAAVGRGTLAELMAKQKSAADLKNSYATQAESPTIMQGIGNMANLALQGFKEGRAGRDLDIQQGRQRELLAQVDPMTGATPEQAAAMGEFDPKLMMELFADRSSRLREQADRENWQPLTPQEMAEIGIDPAVDGPYMRNITNGEIKSLKGGGLTVQNNEAKVETEWGKGLAKQFSEQMIADAATGAAATMRGGQLDVLDTLADQMVTGTPAVIAQFARQYGIQLGEGADKTAMFAGIIDGMAPKERAEGSGSLSNYDVQALKNSLPSFLDTTQGIHRLTAYLRGMNNYNAQLAKIAQQTTSILDPMEARKFYYAEANKLANPLAGFIQAQKAAANPATTTDPAATGGEYTLEEIQAEIAKKKAAAAAAAAAGGP